MTSSSSAITLENGNRRTTPAGDNLLLDFVRAEADAYAALAVAAGGRAAVDDELGVAMADSASPSPFGNVAHVLRPLESDPATVARRLYAFFAGDGGPFLVFSPWPVSDLGPYGFGLAGHPPLMLRPPGRHGSPEQGSGLPGLRVVEARTPSALVDFERTIIDAYPAPELAPFGAQPRLLGDRLLGTNWRFFVGYQQDRPVATAAAVVTDRLVAVEAVSTRAECRGRGFGAAVTAAALGVADRPSLLVASDLGRGVYERLGYLALMRYTLWVGHR